MLTFLAIVMCLLTMLACSLYKDFTAPVGEPEKEDEYYKRILGEDK